MSDSSSIHFSNQTSTDVTFGLYSAYNNHALQQKVKAGGSHDSTMKHPDARTVAAWINGNNVYPNNENPYATIYLFADKSHYHVTMTDDGLVISLA